MARNTEIAKYHNYYGGVIASVYGGFKDRFVTAGLTYPVTQVSFFSQNEIRAIIEKRISAIPIDGVEFQVFKPDQDEPDEALTDWVNDWLADPNFGDGRTWSAFADEALRYIEIDGEAALKIILRDGVPQVRRWPDENLTIETEPDNLFDIIAFDCEWTRTVEGDDSESTQKIDERIDSKEYARKIDGNSEEEAHSFGFIPVVFIKREDQEGETHGRSGIADLIEPQDTLNRCLTDIARANKYGPWGLYCVEDTGLPPMDDITISPGAIIGTPIRKVGGEGAAESLFREKEETLDAMYRIAGISRDKANEIAKASQASGKALVILNAQGRRYAENLIARLRRGYAELCAKALVMATGANVTTLEQVKVVVSFPSLDADDPQAALSRATLLFAEGFPRDALADLGYDPSQVETMMALKEKEPGGYIPTNALPSGDEDEKKVADDDDESD